MDHRTRRSVTPRCIAVSLALVAALLLAPSPAMSAPPGNDAFANAIDLGSTASVTTTGSNAEATTEDR